MHKYAYTIHYKQFACDCPVWDAHNRRTLITFCCVTDTMADRGT